MEEMKAEVASEKVLMGVQSQEPRESWNFPRSNVWRIAASFYTFVIMGMTDAASGALLLSIQSFYKINYTVVSLLFLSPVIGYVSSSLLNDFFHRRLGQRGIALLGSCCHIVTFTVLSVHPPYPLVVLVFVLSGFSTGVFYAAWCAWVSGLTNASKVQGFLHACYATGATISPSIATFFITSSRGRRYHFYYLMVGLCVIELGLSSAAFWGKTPSVYRKCHSHDAGQVTGRTKEAMKHRVTWMFAIFILLYLGIEVGLSGWSITFLVEARHGHTRLSGIVGSCYWVGQVIGRVLYALSANWVCERRVMAVLVALSIVLVLLYWLIYSFIVSSVMLALLGLTLGPLFPASISLQASLTPSYLHVGAIGFSSGISMVGAAIFPFSIGALAENYGIKVLQPLALFILVVMFLVWQMMPKTMLQVRNMEP